METATQTEQQPKPLVFVSYGEIVLIVFLNCRYFCLISESSLCL